MAYYPDIDSLIEYMDANPDREGTVSTTAECFRFYSGVYERGIYSIAHVAGVELEMTKRKSLLGVTFYLTVNGTSENLSKFFRRLKRLAS